MTTALAASGLATPLDGIQLVGVDKEDIESQKRIFAHAMKVLHHHQQMTDSAMKVCICLYLCREEFKNSGDRGWEAFCDANFKQLDMQDTHIRAAIRTGRALWNVMNNKNLESSPGAAEGTFSRMSRYALTTFSEAPEELRAELASRLIALSEQTGKAPTSREVRTEYAELVTELNEARDALKLKDDALTRMNSELQTADARVNDLREQAERLNREVTRLNSTPRVTVEDSDPNSARVRRELADLQSTLERVKGELKAAEDELQAARDAQESLQTTVGARAAQDKQALATISAMEKELSGLIEKWAPVYLVKLQECPDPSIKARLSAIATNLGALAGQLMPVEA